MVEVPVRGTGTGTAYSVQIQVQVRYRYIHIHVVADGRCAPREREWSPGTFLGTVPFPGTWL